MLTNAAQRPLQADSSPIPAWRGDLDPNALPPTPTMTLGQRRVLSACLQQFAARGFVASSTRDIASAIGMQSPSLYNHFPSKDAMLSALLLLGYEHYNERVMAALVASDSAPAAQLSAVVREHILISCEYAGLSVVIERELVHLPHDALVVVVGHRAQAAMLVRQVLRRGQETGEFQARHLETTISTLAGMGQSAAMTFPYSSELVASDYAGEYVDLALRLVGARPAEAVA